MIRHRVSGVFNGMFDYSVFMCSFGKLMNMNFFPFLSSFSSSFFLLLLEYLIAKQ